METEKNDQIEATDQINDQAAPVSKNIFTELLENANDQDSDFEII